MNHTRPMWRRIAVLAVGGALAFWVANLAISVTPVAAEYRAALSIPYVPMLVAALAGGLVLGFAVSYGLVRHGARIPVTNPVLESMVLSLLVLVAVTVLVEVPAKFLTPMANPVRYFLIGTSFNLVRILALGAVVGLLNGRPGHIGHMDSPSRRDDQVSGDLGHIGVL
jgi:hypothetical protein